MENKVDIILAKYFFLHLIFITVFSAKVFAQFSFETNMQNYYDDNIYNTSYKVDDFVNSFSLNSGYNIESDFNNLQFYYMGNISYYQKNIFKSSNSHKVGVVNTYLLSENDNPINAGLNYSWRNNRESFIIFDFSQLSAYVNYRHSISGRSYVLIGYIFNKNDYDNFDVFSHYEHRSFITGMMSFETETTLSLGLKYNLKQYTNKIPKQSGSNNVSQLGLTVNVSQSIGIYTEISGYASFRKNITDGTRYFSYNDFVVYEEEIFNDLYSNDGYELGFSLIRYLSAAVLTKAEFIYSKKNFSSIPVPDAEGYDTDLLRNDKQIAGALAIEFYLSKLIGGMSLELSWNYIRSKSNDLFYNYDNNLLSADLNWGL
jgi:hypothetical protein